MGGDLQVNVSRAGETVVVALVGQAHLDMEEANGRLAEIAAQHPQRVVVDASGLTFLGSVGMQWLMELRRVACGEKGKLRIAGLHPLIATALRHARILELFEVYADVNAALAKQNP